MNTEAIDEQRDKRHLTSVEAQMCCDALIEVHKLADEDAAGRQRLLSPIRHPSGITRHQ